MTEKVETTEQAAPQAQPVTLGLNDLQTVLTIIDTVTQRGAFKANELAAVGILYNRVQSFLEAAQAAQAAQQAENGEQPATEPASE